MAAAIKALNAKIRANPVSDYLCSTHFWGPASNFGIPLAAVADTQKDPDMISGPMTAALVGYSTVFMRYAFAVTPRNYLLFGCHAVNFSAQSVQAYRYLSYWKMGGREKALEEKARSGVDSVVDASKGELNVAEQKAKELGAKAKETVQKVTG